MTFMVLWQIKNNALDLADVLALYVLECIYYYSTCYKWWHY